MLDLNFVRGNLPLIERKLRDRGMNPEEVLRDFSAVDARRREHITNMERLRATQNKASEEIARLKREKQDASAQMAEMRRVREQVAELEKQAAVFEAQLQDILKTIPNLPHQSVPVGGGAEENVEVRRWGAPPQFDFAPKPHWELGEQLGVLDLERAVKLTGRALRRLLGPRGAHGARAGQLHARPAHPRARLHRSPAAVHGQRRVHVRHRPVAQI